MRSTLYPEDYTRVNIFEGVDSLMQHYITSELKCSAKYLNYSLSFVSTNWPRLRCGTRVATCEAAA